MDTSIPAGKFKASCLKLMDEVAATGKAVLITKHGRAVAKLVPAHSRPKPIAGALAGQLEIVGDIVAPTGAKWDASA